MEDTTIIYKITGWNFRKKYILAIFGHFLAKIFLKMANGLTLTKDGQIRFKMIFFQTPSYFMDTLFFL